MDIVKKIKKTLTSETKIWNPTTARLNTLYSFGKKPIEADSWPKDPKEEQKRQKSGLKPRTFTRGRLEVESGEHYIFVGRKVQQNNKLSKRRYYFKISK